MAVVEWVLDVALLLAIGTGVVLLFLANNSFFAARRNRTHSTLNKFGLDIVQIWIPSQYNEEGQEHRAKYIKRLKTVLVVSCVVLILMGVKASVFG